MKSICYDKAPTLGSSAGWLWWKTIS